jgi:hypothetical protein
MAAPLKKSETITITNFSGRLTRILNGDLNSGFAKFTSSFGYDPFSKPLNLTWLQQAADITGPINNMPLAAINNGLTAYVVDQGGRFYTITKNSLANPTIDSVVGIGSLISSSDYNFGASLEMYGQQGQLYVGTDTRVVRVNTDGSAATSVGSATRYVANTRRPLRQFQGRLLFGNGPSFGVIDETGTVTSSVFNAFGVRFGNVLIFKLANTVNHGSIELVNLN